MLKEKKLLNLTAKQPTSFYTEDLQRAFSLQPTPLFKDTGTKTLYSHISLHTVRFFLKDEKQSNIN